MLFTFLWQQKQCARLVRGFAVIVDDYGDIAACRQAVTDYRQAHGITEPITMVDWTGAFWRRR